MISELSLSKNDKIDSEEARECLSMILITEQSETTISATIGDNFRNLVLSLKQIHLKHLDFLIESLLSSMTLQMCSIKIEGIEMP
jgi:hypothetical protein